MLGCENFSSYKIDKFYPTLFGIILLLNAILTSCFHSQIRTLVTLFHQL
jgi:hypothetical protein